MPEERKIPTSADTRQRSKPGGVCGVAAGTGRRHELLPARRRKSSARLPRPIRDIFFGMEGYRSSDDGSNLELITSFVADDLNWPRGSPRFGRMTGGRQKRRSGHHRLHHDTAERSPRRLRLPLRRLRGIALKRLRDDRLQEVGAK